MSVHAPSRARTKKWRVSPHSAKALSAGDLAGLFPAQSAASFQALPRAAQRALVGMHRLGDGAPLQCGQAAIAAALGTSVRSVQRWIRVLEAAGFVREQREASGVPWRVFLHPATAGLVAAGQATPKRSRRPPAPSGPVLARSSVAVRCAGVRRSDGTPFVPTPYLVDLLTDDERTRCRYAAETGAPIATDPELDDRLRSYLLRLAQRERAAALERARAGFVVAGFSRG